MAVLTSNRATARDQIIKEDDDSDDQEDMDQAPCDLENYPSEEPCNDQNDGEPNHGNPSCEVDAKG